MWDYRIIRCDLWWNIYKKREKDWLISVRFLGSQGKRVLNKDMAKIFYHREDAVSALIVTKAKDERESPN